MTEEEKWFPFVPDDYLAKEKVLFCFCHAGGTALAFQEWMKAVSNISVIPVELPGRGSRIGEPFLKSYKELVNKVSIAVMGMARGKQIYLYGHSMGAVAAYEVAAKLTGQFGIGVQKVYVAGRHAPMDDDPSPYRAGQGKEALIEELKRVGETPEHILSNPQFQKVILPIILEDYALHDSYQYDGKILSIPLEAHCGSEDREAGRIAMERWRRTVSGSFRVKEYQGGHFFLHNESYRKELFEDVEQNSL